MSLENYLVNFVENCNTCSKEVLVKIRDNSEKFIHSCDDLYLVVTFFIMS